MQASVILCHHNCKFAFSQRCGSTELPREVYCRCIISSIYFEALEMPVSSGSKE
jgi:hypothetical protein